MSRPVVLELTAEEARYLADALMADLDMAEDSYEPDAKWVKDALRLNPGIQSKLDDAQQGKEENATVE